MTWHRRRTQSGAATEESSPPSPGRTPIRAPESGATPALLLERARCGDREAMSTLLTPHEPMLRQICRRALLPEGNTEDAEDAVQETFLRALRGLGTYRGDAELRTWLVRIALNVCYEQRRRRPQSTAPEALLDTLPAPLTASPERATVSRYLREEALARLTPLQRTAFQLKEVEGWSLIEIGQAQGWSVVRVKVELFRARRKLAAWARQIMEEEQQG